jgi:lysyl-tRNA synthetase class 2
MQDSNDQIQQRLKKLEELRAMGINPYGQRFEPTSTAKNINEQHQSVTAEELEKNKKTYLAAGRLLALRRFGKAAFAHLQDGSGKIQVYFKQDVLGDRGFALFEKLDIGDFIGVEGPLFRTKTKELTILVEKLTLLSKSLRPLPEKWHGLSDVEVRYRQRYLDLVANPEVKEAFILRGRIIETIRDFLNERGFLEVETPMMQPIPGGAAARPFVTHHNALGIDLYLRIAPELYLKRLIVGGFERVYEINRNFRNEGISTVHNPEFTMLEFYIAYADYQTLVRFTEELLTTVARKVLGKLELKFKDETIDFTPPWKRQTFLQSIAEANSIDANLLNERSRILTMAKKLEIPVKGNEPSGKILDLLFETTVQPKLVQPTFILDYPIEISPLAKRKINEPELTERFELFIAGREVANAFSELNDPQDQRKRFEQQMAQRAAGDLEAPPLDEDYLRALEYGMPPAAGEGIGIDRLVMVMTNQPSIRDVILFPQMKPDLKKGQRD